MLSILINLSLAQQANPSQLLWDEAAKRKAPKCGVGSYGEGTRCAIWLPNPTKKITFLIEINTFASGTKAFDILYTDEATNDWYNIVDWGIDGIIDGGRGSGVPGKAPWNGEELYRKFWVNKAYEVFGRTWEEILSLPVLPQTITP